MPKGVYDRSKAKTKADGAAAKAPTATKAKRTWTRRTPPTALAEGQGVSMESRLTKLGALEGIYSTVSIASSQMGLQNDHDVIKVLKDTLLRIEVVAEGIQTAHPADEEVEEVETAAARVEEEETGKVSPHASALRGPAPVAQPVSAAVPRPFPTPVPVPNGA